MTTIRASLTRLSEPAPGLGVCAGMFPQEMTLTSLLAHCNAAARANVPVQCRLVMGTIPTRQLCIDAIAHA